MLLYIRRDILSPLSPANHTNTGNGAVYNGSYMRRRHALFWDWLSARLQRSLAILPPGGEDGRIQVGKRSRVNVRTWARGFNRLGGRLRVVHQGSKSRVRMMSGIPHLAKMRYTPLTLRRPTNDWMREAKALSPHQEQITQMYSTSIICLPCC